MPLSRASSSLRLWIHSASLLAVLAGFGVLLLLRAGINRLELVEIHQSLVEGLMRDLNDGREDGHTLGRHEAFGIEAWFDSRPPRQQRPRLYQAGGQHWIESRTPLSLVGAPPLSLQVRQNISSWFERETNQQLLLLAAAGLSSLFTSLLLRQVLRRGLNRPIQRFCDQVQGITNLTTTYRAVSEADQPTELRPLARSFNALQQRLAAAWERERTYTDGVAHELRTPITLISAQAQSLLRQPLPERQRQAALAIAQEAQRMGAMVRDLLDLARQDAGRLHLVCAGVNPEATVLEAYDRLRPLAVERLRLAPAGQAAPPPEVPADRERLLQCLSCLVENALRYTAGPVELAVAACRDQVVWHVRDHGPGVADAEKHRIFEPFVRGQAAGAGDQRGSGLGLAVVRLLMEAMGGGVAVEDAPGGGADFQLRLPLPGSGANDRSPASA